MKNRVADIVSRRGFVAAIGAITGGGLATAAAAQTGAKAADSASGKIGVIDFQGAIANTAEGKQLLAQAQSEFAPRQTELNNISKQISDINNRLAAGQNTLSDDEKNRLNIQVNQLQQSGTRKQQDLQDDEQARQQDIAQTVGSKMVDVVDKYAKENGYVLILDGSSQNSIVVYAADSTNVTQPIISQYDSANPVKASGAAPSSSTAPRTAPSTRPSGSGMTTPKSQ